MPAPSGLYENVPLSEDAIGVGRNIDLWWMLAGFFYKK
jgi:hypothetical protein